MKDTLLKAILNSVSPLLSEKQLHRLEDILDRELSKYEIEARLEENDRRQKANYELLQSFISAKKIEGCSTKTLNYYLATIRKLIKKIGKDIHEVDTKDIRGYMSDYQIANGVSRITIDNMRRIFSTFFAWLEEEDYIGKSPVRRIHKVRTETLIKEVMSDENIELLRDGCHVLRDLAIVDLLSSTGIRVGELVNLNREDIDFHERQCVVFGKGNKEREVYFNARTKVHLRHYIDSRTDDNPALFVSLANPHTRLTISGIETRLRSLGRRLNIAKVHPHKFRRTLATMAIDKGMPIEQVQRLLGHVKIDTTLQYAMVNQNNVKMAHRKYLG